jgi:CRP/FNR family transcriptional regulator, cyclic AMP receptor protein
VEVVGEACVGGNLQSTAAPNPLNMGKPFPDETKRRLMEQLAGWQLPDELVAELIENSHCIPYTPGASIFVRGSTADVLFCVLSGLVKVCHPSPNGTRVVIKLAGPGDIIGFADVIESGGRRTQAYDAEALTKSNVALFTRDQVMRAVQKLPPAKLVSLLEILNSSWSASVFFYTSLLGMSFRERLEVLFNELAARFGVTDSRGIILTPELSHEAIAEMIASSRPMVSRLIAEMVEEGVVTRQGKHYCLLNKCGAQVADSSEARKRFQRISRETPRTWSPQDHAKVFN